MMMCIIYLYKREKKGRNFCNELLFVVLIFMIIKHASALCFSLSLFAQKTTHIEYQ
jgi:hypothetical protein